MRWLELLEGLNLPVADWTRGLISSYPTASSVCRGHQKGGNSSGLLSRLRTKAEPRMAALEGRTKMHSSDVGVTLGSSDGGMAEELLDDSEVGAVLEEEGGGGVAEHVGGDVTLDSCCFRDLA